MKEMKTLTVGGQTYKIVDGNAVHFDGPQDLTPKQQAQARDNLGITINPDIHAEYFTITKDGVLSLKPEYRGASPFTTYLDSISDMGSGVAGSKNVELPKFLVIPEIVDDIAVDSLADGIFCNNDMIEQAVLPATITTIPLMAFAACNQLKHLHNTDFITDIEDGALQTTILRKISFPKLKTMGASAFNGCDKLIYADIGEVESIPDRAFFRCDSLNTVKARGVVTSVGTLSFQHTPKLNKADFLKNVTNIGKLAFLGSDIEYPWDTLTGCTFGANATSLQFNPTDFWSACSFTPCENPVPTHLSQNDPLWMSKTIGGSTKKYVAGCALFATMHMYSGMTGTKFDSPEEFVELVRSVNPSLIDSYSGTSKRCCQILKALGLNAQHYDECDQTALQALYDALAAGGYAFHIVPDGTGIGGHAIMSCGITSDGELIFVDSAYQMSSGDGRIPKPKYAFKYKNFIAKSNDITIVMP